MVIRFVAAVFALTITSEAANSQTTTLYCTYAMSADNHDGLQRANDFNLTFVVDSDSGKAYMVGNNGSAEVILVSAGEGRGLTFLEVTGGGNVMLTTITSAGESVHSRHTVIGTELVPSQYYGTCEFR